MNVHSPVRQADESQEQYRFRRALSKRLVKTMTEGPTQPPALAGTDYSRFFLGQHTNTKRNTARRLKASAGGRRAVRRARIAILKATQA